MKLQFFYKALILGGVIAATRGFSCQKEENNRQNSLWQDLAQWDAFQLPRHSLWNNKFISHPWYAFERIMDNSIVDDFHLFYDEIWPKKTGIGTIHDRERDHTFLNPSQHNNDHLDSKQQFDHTNDDQVLSEEAELKRRQDWERKLQDELSEEQRRRDEWYQEKLHKAQQEQQLREQLRKQAHLEEARRLKMQQEELQKRQEELSRKIAEREEATKQEQVKRQKWLEQKRREEEQRRLEDQRRRDLKKREQERLQQERLQQEQERIHEEQAWLKKQEEQRIAEEKRQRQSILQKQQQQLQREELRRQERLKNNDRMKQMYHDHPNTHNSNMASLKTLLFSMEAPGYYPADISVTTHKGTLHVAGSHICGCDEQCFIREFERKTALPDGVDTDSISASLDSLGHLQITGLQSGHPVSQHDVIVPVEGLDIPRQMPSNAKYCPDKPAYKLAKIDPATGSMHRRNSYKFERKHSKLEDDDVTIEVADN